MLSNYKNNMKMIFIDFFIDLVHMLFRMPFIVEKHCSSD